MNASLERAQARLLDRRAAAGSDSAAHAQVAQNRHAKLKLAYVRSGHTHYLLIRYCPDCLRGTVIDMVRELPEGVPNAKELGIKRAKMWRLDCLNT